MAERKEGDVQSSSWCGFEVTFREGEQKVPGSYQVTVSREEDALDGCFLTVLFGDVFFHQQIG